jgi:hypothetical protein
MITQPYDKVYVAPVRFLQISVESLVWAMPEPAVN